MGGFDHWKMVTSYDSIDIMIVFQNIVTTNK